MKLISYGCSFIFGTDLSDCTYDPLNLYPVPSSLTWPALVAKNLDLEYKCRASGGMGNLAILDRLLNDLESRSEPFVCVIGWTFIDRFDYVDPGGGPTGTNDWSTIRPDSDDTVSKMYYSHLHSDYRDKLSSLLYMSTAIDALQAKKIPFVMTSIDNLIFDKKFHSGPGVQNLQNRIKPYLLDFEGKDFLSWSRSKGFTISDNNHPLDHAHRTASELIIDAIRHIV